IDTCHAQTYNHTPSLHDALPIAGAGVSPSKRTPLCLKAPRETVRRRKLTHELEPARDTGNPRPHRLHPRRHRLELSEDGPHRRRSRPLDVVVPDRPPVAPLPWHPDPAARLPRV